jgi:hypothetical protein
MNNEDVQTMGTALGKPIAEILCIFLIVVNALRKQPGFDDSQFCAEIQALLLREDLSEIQRNALSTLIDNERK